MKPDYCRTPKFESLEDRLVMSAQALTDFVADFGVDPHTNSVDIDQQIVALSNGENIAGPSANDLQSIREQYNLDGNGQTIAVIDSGIAFDHLAFGEGFGAGHRVVGGYDFAENDSNPYDDGPLGLHGTHVTGIAGGSSDEYEGVAPGVDLVSLRVFDDNGAGSIEWVESALQWVHDNRNAFENPITTVNLSIGTNWNSDTLPEAAQLEDEFAQLEADGIFISVAAGNLFSSYNEQGLSYPAASPFVVPVASHGDDGQISDFSQRNERVLVAPGEQILSTVPDYVLHDGASDGYLRTSGTSQAAPYVAGASALLRQALEFTGVQNIDQDLIYSHFRETSDIIHDQVTGGSFHRLNLARAIEAAIGDDHGNSHSTSTNLGSLDGNEQINGMIGSTSDADHFRFTATENGTVTLKINNDANFTPMLGAGPSLPQQNGNEISFAVEAGNDYRFSIGSSQGTGRYSIDISHSPQPIITDPVSVQNGVLTVRGTSGNDQIQFHQGAVLDVHLNGESFTFNSAHVSEIVVIGGAGNDSIVATFSNRLDRAVINGLRADASHHDFDFTARGFESIDFIAQNDAGRLVIRDTASQDFVQAEQGFVSITTNGTTNTAAGFTNVIVSASDGYDRIVVTGTDGDDRFIANDGRNVLRSDTGRIVSVGFDHTRIAASGGSDIATLRDSAGNDLYKLARRSFQLHTDQYAVHGSGFERIHAVASSGLDTIELEGSDGQDKLLHRTERTRLSSDWFLNVASGFDQIHVQAGAGNDIARIFDSAGNDSIYSQGRFTQFVSAEARLNASGFETVYAYATNGGYDTATF